MLLKPGILHHPDTFWYKGSFGGNNADSIITVIIVTLHNQDLIVRPSISDTRQYLCMLTLIYVWLSTCTYAGMCIYTLHTHCPANRSPTMTFLSKIPQICARFDHAKAPGSGKAQDGDLRGHNLFVGGKLEPGAHFFRSQQLQEAAVAAADLQGQCTTEWAEPGCSSSCLRGVSRFSHNHSHLFYPIKGSITGWVSLEIPNHQPEPPIDIGHIRFNDPQVLQDFVRQAELHRCLRLF